METTVLTDSELDIVFDRAQLILESMSHSDPVMQVVIPWRPKQVYIWVELKKKGASWERGRLMEIMSSDP